MLECYRNLSENKQIKKRNYANNKNKNMTDEGRERKKEYLKNYYNKRKKLLNHLINQTGILEKQLERKRNRNF